MSDGLRIGFVGGGFITRFHIQSLVEVRDCTVAGVSSATLASAEGAAALARELGVGPAARAYASTEELAADETYEFMFVLGQARVRGAVQMIINPVAIR